jgi:hypothetical protein
MRWRFEMRRLFMKTLSRIVLLFVLTSALAAVDRNNAERGLIAALNEYGSRPLLKELEKAGP